MDLAGLYIYAYLVGAVPTAYIIGRLAKGIDIREYGSGNVGASNVFKSVGKGWIIPVGLFELFVKGGSSIWFGKYLLDMDRSSFALMGLPLLTVAGNNWSVFFRFGGGRGVAVAMGALFALAYREFIVFAVVGYGLWVLFKSGGISILVATLLLPFWSLLFGEPPAITWFCVGLLFLVTLKRLFPNWSPLPAGVPWRVTLWNRLIRDRDFADRDEWLARHPTVGD